MIKPEIRRCPWARTDIYVRYHDREWGVPVHNDRRLFEFLILEGAQAGLSWETIRRLPGCVRRLQRRGHSQIRRQEAAKFAFEPGYRPQPAKDRRNYPERARLPGRARRSGIIRRISLAICGWSADTEPLEVDGAGTCPNRGVGPHEQRPAATRVQIRGQHNLLRSHASSRHGK